ncbi:MAG: methyltransferase domain-containing protein [Chloroflexi bacterium]|nr:methyltransferase domain-containing protein [Chloroflexota bacterium]
MKIGSLSFDRMVEHYDETRSCDAACLDAALDLVTERFPPRSFGNLFEPGIGTGRIAIPLARRGYRVTGVDISGEMLARLTRSSQTLPISCQKADVTKLPFRDAAFDVAIATHLFYFIPEWKRAVDEILRVLKSDGALILMHTGAGMEVPFLNQRYKELCAEQSCPIKSIGVNSTRQVVEHCKSNSHRAEWIRDRWQWTTHVPLDQALDHLQARAYSFTTFAPDDVHSTAIERLETELKHQYGSLGVVQVPNQVYVVVISSPG